MDVTRRETLEISVGLVIAGAGSAYAQDRRGYDLISSQIQSSAEVLNAAIRQEVADDKYLLNYVANDFYTRLNLVSAALESKLFVNLEVATNSISNIPRSSAVFKAWDFLFRPQITAITGLIFW
jgi:hypothetical protein